ncbi:MAG: acetolactate synthase large subunit [Fusobacteriaceae bacterium]|nr:acetolactate synthase large subunit [Fusobacteriaceae bacterium]
MKKINGARIILEGLKRQGVDTIFGYPGGKVIPLYNELYDFPGIHHILTRHEQGAAHAADGYARVTGKVGVCVSTSGPGATNLVTGIMTAYMDSIPMVAITGQVATYEIGKDAFQESDITGITMPITKHNYLVKDVRDLPRIIKEAFYIASTGRPGPVLIDIPSNIQQAEINLEEYERLHNMPIKLDSYNPNYDGHPKQIKSAIRLINQSKRPVILAGAGIIKSKASKEFIEFVERTNIPVGVTLLGLGSIPTAHELCLGMLGMHGTYAANYSVYESDLVIAIGMRFDDRVTGNLETFAKNAKVIHIDIDPAEIGKNKKADIPIVGDVKRVLTKFLEKMPQREKTEWNETVTKWKNENPLVYKNSSEEIKPQYLIEKISELTKGEAIIVTDVGQHQMWAAQYYKFKNPDSHCTSGGAGTMGYALPAALGAKVGQPNKPVIAIVGDGGIQMTSQELMTLAHFNIPIKVVIVNNSYLGMVRQWQEIFYSNRYSQVDLEISPDFVKLAEAYSLKGVRLTTPSELDEKLEELLTSDEPVVIDVKVSKEENVLPMVPAGGDSHKMLGIKGEL